MTCRTCKHRLDVTLWGCWLATGCRIGLVLRDESAKKRNDGRHPEFSEQYARARGCLLRDQYAHAREAGICSTAQQNAADTYAHAREAGIHTGIHEIGICIAVLVTRPVTTEKRNAWGCLRVRATLLSLWPQG